MTFGVGWRVLRRRTTDKEVILAEKKDLPDELQALRAVLPDLIRRLEEKIPYASALVTQESGLVLNVDSRQTAIREITPSRGVVFTLFNGRFFQEWATDRLDIDFLTKKIEEIRRMLEPVPESEHLFRVDPGKPLEKHFTSSFEIDPDTISLSDMVDACRNLVDRTSARDRRIVNTSVQYRDGKEYKVFINRNRVLSSSLTTCGIILAVVGMHHGSTQMNYIGSGGVTGFEAIKFRSEAIEEMIEDLGLLFESRPLEPGIYDVIASPEVSGILAHEAFGHGVESDMFVKQRARAAEYMGRKVASDLVDMVDDPSFPGLNGSYFFDDEGWTASPTKIIEGGVLKRALTDLRSASVLGIPRSANGRRESFERKVYTRMSNTFFEAGNSTFDAMIGGMDRGLYLKKSGSGMEDPQGWGIQVTINLAREIRNGRLASRVYAPVTMTGYVPDLLMSITQVGNDLGFMGAGGRCGKGHKEMVRVSAGGPHLRFKARLG